MLVLLPEPRPKPKPTPGPGKVERTVRAAKTAIAAGSGIRILVYLRCLRGRRRAQLGRHFSFTALRRVSNFVATAYLFLIFLFALQIASRRFHCVLFTFTVAASLYFCLSVVFRRSKSLHSNAFQLSGPTFVWSRRN